MTQPSPPATIPIFSAPDFDATARFYGALGFVERGRWGDYLILVHPIGIVAGGDEPGSVSVTLNSRSAA